MRKITRKSRMYRGKRKFSYYHRDVRITDKSILKDIERIRIPPAWNNVEINLSKNADRLAVGTDEAGRKQSIYNQKFVLKNRKERMCKIARFIEELPAIRRRVDKDIRSEFRRTRAIATIIKMMDTCCPLRIGNDVYRRRYKTYGLSTLERKHMAITRDKIKIRFVGKKHMINERDIPRVGNEAVYESLVFFYKSARRIRGVDGKYWTPIFTHCSKTLTNCDINDYLGDFSAKDFRTLRANLELLRALGLEGSYKTKTEMVKKRNRALDIASEVLNNTRAICRSNYVLKPILTMYEQRPRSLMMRIARTSNMESVLHGLLMECSRKRANNF